jgi:hypothetical protein
VEAARREEQRPRRTPRAAEVEAKGLCEALAEARRPLPLAEHMKHAERHDASPGPESGMISASKRRIFGACAVLTLLAVAGTASAQWRDLSPDGPRMTREDLDRQRAAARSLLDKEPPPVGASASWSNPQSGARGRVTMAMRATRAADRPAGGCATRSRRAARLARPT